MPSAGFAIFFCSARPADDAQVSRGEMSIAGWGEESRINGNPARTLREPDRATNPKRTQSKVRSQSLKQCDAKNYERAANSISIVDVGNDKYVRIMGQVRTSLETIWDTYIHNHTHTTTRTRTPARTHIHIHTHTHTHTDTYTYGPFEIETVSHETRTLRKRYE